ncbi:hypothetical protein TREMEDRAFT_31446, partial [Tremella mesenterica DSM 1558]|uniref:uncharacterized protein n=1 Tax=Tremella mesenterica (strain ATCC 24925 / CBS 8224 / DSM 1558 / NBRC 9311 / NRRL Y-6157 / RJB 2259-6 / UBC 559-6) TaxID=578456 RepID=UPI0003F48CFE
VFFRSSSSVGIVNLKPLLPGHVLLIPRRIVPRLADLRSDEVIDLFLSVQKVGKILERVYEGEALTISLQDGKIAGQSVPHVHVHIIPRRPTDFKGDNDRIYPALETSELRLEHDLARAQQSTETPDESSSTAGWRIPKDEDRSPRTMEEMEREATRLAGLFTDLA